MRTQSRINVRAGLPLSHRARIESVPGVRDVGMITLIGGYLSGVRRPHRGLPRSTSSASHTIGSFDRRRSLRRSDAPHAHGRDHRTRARPAATAGRSAIGSPCGRPSGARPTARTIGRSTSSAPIGIPEGEFPADGSFWINYGYFDEERAFAKGTTSFYTLRVDDADRAAAIARRDRRAVRELDRRDADAKRDRFLSARRSSASATSGSSSTRSSAPCCSRCLFVTGNTMMQSIRERVPELAVLKTYGYSNLAVTRSCSPSRRCCA